ncbi:MAG TPA: hypothetical protein VFU94_07260 [Conexibacter sp.]|nr:hypothetical protein [Conexibacter sp.]
MSEQRPNIWTETWQRTVEHGPFGVRGTRVGALAGMAEDASWPRARSDYFAGEPE